MGLWCYFQGGQMRAHGDDGSAQPNSEPVGLDDSRVTGAWRPNCGWNGHGYRNRNFISQIWAVSGEVSLRLKSLSLILYTQNNYHSTTYFHFSTFASLTSSYWQTGAWWIAVRRRIQTCSTPFRGLMELWDSWPVLPFRWSPSKSLSKWSTNPSTHCSKLLT